MSAQTKVVQLDLFIKQKEEVAAVIIEAKKRNFSRRVNHLFGELERVKSELKKEGFWEDDQ
jgi:hypothetical protein